MLSDARSFTLRPATRADLPVLGDIDTDAGALFEQAGLFLDLPEDHEFPMAERRRWLESITDRCTLLAIVPGGDAVGFAAVGRIDGESYLAQLSVRHRCMRRGIGSALLTAAAGLAGSRGAGALWLTTYSHLPWNRPFYAAHGFEVVAESACGPELLREHALEKRWLPFPEQRVVMRRRLTARGQLTSATSVGR